MKASILPFVFIAFCSLHACSNSKVEEQNTDKRLVNPPSQEENQTTKSPNDEVTIQEVDLEVQEKDSIRSVFERKLKELNLSKKYQVADSHSPYYITGFFNQDAFSDTAIIVKDKGSKKEGILVSYGLMTVDTIVLFGAGNTVLNQNFDSFSWVGEFKTVRKGEKWASNIDSNGEIIDGDIPDSLKTTLPNDGIYIHASESCGGGIIYFDNTTYHWIQQE